MMKKMIALVLSLLMAATMLAGCGEKQTDAQKRQAAGEIVVGIATDLASSLDPYQMSTADTREILFNVFEGLYKPDSSGNMVPAVASSCEISEDGLTYRFTLREGVSFHNGAAVTAEDVLRSYATCAETGVDANVKAALENVESVSAEGSSIIIRLKTPNSDFLVYAASVYITPAGYTEQATGPVGTGPFRYVSRAVQQNIVLERFADYWGEKALVNKVTFNIYDTDTALMTALDSDAVDMISHLTSAQITGLKDSYTLLEGSMNLVQALYLNNAEKPLDDVRVRQAICYAIDVPAMLELTADGHGSRLGSAIYPSFAKYFDETLVDAYAADAAKAKALLTEAGYPNGFALEITVPSNYSNHVDTALVLAEQLKAVGIAASVKEVEWSSWLNDVYKGRRFQATVSGFDASTLTAGALLNRYVSDSSKNMCGFASAEYDAMIAEAAGITDDVRRTELYRQAEKILSEQAASAYLQDLADFVALRSTLTGYRFYPLYVMDLSTVGYR